MYKSIFIIFLFFLTAIIFGQNSEIKKTYYPSGKLESEGNYVNGVKHGVYKEFFEDGTLWKEWNFVNGKEEEFQFGILPMAQ